MMFAKILLGSIFLILVVHWIGQLISYESDITVIIGFLLLAFLPMGVIWIGKKLF